MPIHNADIAAIFEEIADLLELEQANPFRVRAYRNAARTVSSLALELKAMVERGSDLDDLPGIGKDLSDKIREIISTGKCSMLERLRKQTPHVLVELLSVPGLGPKRVRALNQELHIHTLEQLARALKDGVVSNIAGFGKKTQDTLLRAITSKISATPKRLKLASAAQYAEPLAEYLRLTPGVRKVTIAGSYRRCQETVGDIDILVAADKHNTAVERFITYDEVAKILSKGQTRAGVILKSGLQVDLRVVGEKSWGSALLYFTGSKAHNIVLRRIAQRAGLKVNEYGIFRGAKQIAGATEESMYRCLGLKYIPPELRENRGEIELAQNGKLPRLVELSDLKGDLHSHTRATDGKNSLREMAQAAKEAGLSYLAITEHSKHLTVAHGLDSKRLQAQIKEIDKLNQELEGITLLKSTEVDILEDGTLDMPDDVLMQLDLVVGSVHSRFNLSREQQTQRVLKALNHPCLSILGHPTGRLIAERDPYDVDMEQIISHAKDKGCFLELNAHPERLDLIAVYCRMAAEQGVLVSINSDAHNIHDFVNLRFGIGQARRGWLQKKDVLNTRSLGELRQLLSKKKKRVPANV